MRGRVPPALWFAPLGALWCVALLTDFHFQMWHPELRGQIFNDMLVRLLHLDPTISRDVVGFEAFTRNGHTYTYFGILPALLRLPAWLLGALNGVEYGRWSCAAALLVLLALLLRTLDMVEAQMPPAHRLTSMQWAMRVVILLSGPQIFLLSTGSVYNEALFWTSALAAAFNLMAVRVIGGGSRPNIATLAGMALVAGLALLARPSIGVALGIATGLLLLREAIAALSDARRLKRLLKLLAPVAILVAFGLVAATVNYARWGNPFTFADNTKYDAILRMPGGPELLRDYGDLSLTRVWFSFLYYTTGVAYFMQTHGPFTNWLNLHYYNIAAPPASDLLLIPLPLALAACGLWRLWRGRDLSRDARITAVMVLLGEAFAGLVVLCYFSLEVRYHADYMPCIMLAAFLGLPVVCAALARTTRHVRRRWFAAVFACVVLGVGGSHYTLVLYKVVDRSVDLPMRRAWVVLAPFAAPALNHP
jgi:hypothetical protein